MRRRGYILLLAGLLAAWTPGAIAQAPSKPVIGFLHAQPLAPGHLYVTKFREGLGEQGFVDGQNVTIVYRWGNSDPAALPALATDLVQRQVAVIVTAGGLASAKAAKAATSTIPIVFITGLDPAENGFVASLNRPGGNATGIALYVREIDSKRLELLRKLVGSTTKIAFLMNGDYTNLGPGAKKQIEDEKSWASQNMDLVLDARSDQQIEASFDTAAKRGIGALLVESDPFFNARRSRLLALTAEYGLAAGFQQREFADGGALMSYGPSDPESYRQAGHYAGRILKGAKPAEMPVWTPEKLELVINLKTANKLGLSMGGSEFRELILSADQIIK
jgi:putative ABC transport system substrate-binding protein